jgi:hypothetical protein
MELLKGSFETFLEIWLSQKKNYLENFSEKVKKILMKLLLCLSIL